MKENCDKKMEERECEPFLSYCDPSDQVARDLGIFRGWELASFQPLFVRREN